jgi:hypothetical protein
MLRAESPSLSIRLKGSAAEAATRDMLAPVGKETRPTEADGDEDARGTAVQNLQQPA